MKKHKNNVDQYSWGENCKGWHLIKSPSLGVIQETMPPDTEEVRHKHEKAQQFFFILKGEAVFELEDEILSIKAGEGVHILPGKVHKIKKRYERGNWIFGDFRTSFSWR
ncbi:MAG TPA: cupin domain-containing protein [Cytophagales bacterium]|nr:cupin domain-containing protein [Cytophagales bacterium]